MIICYINIALSQHSKCFTQITSFKQMPNIHKVLFSSRLYRNLYLNYHLTYNNSKQTSVAWKQPHS